MSDIKTAVMALEAADQRLRESGDAATYKIRAQIAKEIEGLESVTLPDVVGVYAEIQLLKEKIDKLAVLLPYAGKPLTESKQIHDHEESTGSGHGILDSVLGQLEGYVTVKHSDQPVTEILTQDQVEFIRQQLGIKVEMIKIALVQQNDALYTASIDDAKQWLNVNFTKNIHSKAFLNNLDGLKKILIRNQLPDISLSLKMIKDITKLRIETDKGQGLNTDSSRAKQKSVTEQIKPVISTPAPAEQPLADEAAVIE
jgi:uroporphyrin-3 C-methyltransferase/uroporphyrinogen III methyltransferase/synthase